MGPFAMSTRDDEPEPVDIDRLLDELDADHPISPDAQRLAAGLRTLYERQADDAADPICDAELAAAMHADHRHDEMVRDLRRLGERMGAMHAGLLAYGMDPDDACHHVSNWMECAVFRRVDRETGTLGM